MILMRLGWSVLIALHRNVHCFVIHNFLRAFCLRVAICNVLIEMIEERQPLHLRASDNRSSRIDFDSLNLGGRQIKNFNNERISKKKGLCLRTRHRTTCNSRRGERRILRLLLDGRSLINVGPVAGKLSTLHRPQISTLTPPIRLKPTQHSGQGNKSSQQQGLTNKLRFCPLVSCSIPKPPAPHSQKSL